MDDKIDEPHEIVSQKTIPWTKDEKIIVNGYHIIYSKFRNGEIVVHFPGRTSMTLQDLQQRRGYQIQLPKVWRKS